MPSSTPIVLNSNGTPPAARIASLTTFPNAWRWTCPGIRSMYELQTPMNGLLKSASLRMAPVARSRLRCGARVKPRLTSSLRWPGSVRWSGIAGWGWPTFLRVVYQRVGVGVRLGKKKDEKDEREQQQPRKERAGKHEHVRDARPTHSGDRHPEGRGQRRSSVDRRGHATGTKSGAKVPCSAPQAQVPWRALPL